MLHLLIQLHQRNAAGLQLRCCLAGHTVVDPFNTQKSLKLHSAPEVAAAAAAAAPEAADIDSTWLSFTDLSRRAVEEAFKGHKSMRRLDWRGPFLPAEVGKAAEAAEGEG